jgi:glycosyltransferase involved in cell wall biosynthesis
MRVALVIAGPYPALRGSQVLVQQLAAGLRARGHAVFLLTHGPRAGGAPRPGLRRVLRDLVLAGRLWGVVRRERIDVIHAHNYEAALAGLVVGRATGRPVVYHGHNAMGEELPTYAHGRIGRWVAARVGRLLDAHVPRRADFCIAVSEELGGMLRRRGVADEGLSCIAPVRDPFEVDAGLVPEGREGLVCYAGNLDGYQNIAFLLRTFARVRARVPHARLVLVTHGEGDIGDLRGAAGVDVVQTTSYAEVRVRLAMASVAVCPRVERSGFPMKLLNYMAAGKAIVASAGSAKGLIDGVTGRIVPDGDEEEFADAVIGLLGDPVERARLGDTARRVVVDPGAWEVVLDRVESIYARVLARRAPTALGLAPGVPAVATGGEELGA